MFRATLFIPVFASVLLLLNGCASSSRAPKQLIAELESRGYVCEKKAPLGSRRQQLICKSPEQIEADARSVQREKDAYIYENPQIVDGVRLY